MLTLTSCNLVRVFQILVAVCKKSLDWLELAGTPAKGEHPGSIAAQMKLGRYVEGAFPFRNVASVAR